MDKVAPNGLSAARAALASGVLLLPWLAAADSQIGSTTERTTARTAAHVDFRIIIPRMLALDVDGAAPPVANAVGPAQTVAIYANSRSIALGATLRASDEPRGGLILSSAARKTISQSAVCAPVSSRAAALSTTLAAAGAAPAGAPAGMICTASMP